VKGYIAMVKQSPQLKHRELRGTKVLIETDPKKCEDGDIIVRIKSLKTGETDVMDIKNFDDIKSLQKPTFKDRLKMLNMRLP